jgi:hypothetical protein
VTRAELVATFREELADLLKREDECEGCQKARRISDHGKLHWQRQCWMHANERFDLALH